MHDISVRVSSPQQQHMGMPHRLHQCGAETCLRRILLGGLGSPVLKGFQKAVCHRFAVHCGCRDACFCALHRSGIVSMSDSWKSDLTQGGLLVKITQRCRAFLDGVSQHPSYGRLCSSKCFRACLGCWRRSRQLQGSFQGRRARQVAGSSCGGCVRQRQRVALELRGALGGRSLPFEGIRHVEALAQQRLRPPLLAGADRPLERPSLDSMSNTMSGKLGSQGTAAGQIPNLYSRCYSSLNDYADKMQPQYGNRNLYSNAMHASNCH